MVTIEQFFAYIGKLFIELQVAHSEVAELKQENATLQQRIKELEESK